MNEHSEAAPARNGAIRVLHVAAWFHPATAYGGPITVTRGLIAAQARIGTEVEVLSTDADGQCRIPLQRAIWDGVPVRYYPAIPLNDHGLSAGLFREIIRRVGQFDVLHCHGVGVVSTTIALWAALVAQVPTVVSPHGSLMQWARSQHRWRKRAYSLLDVYPLHRTLLHAMSDQELSDLTAAGYRNTCLVPPAIEQKEFSRRVVPDARETLRLPRRGRMVVWMGRFHPVKNLELLLESTRDMDVIVVLAGPATTPYAQAIRERAASRSDVYLVGALEGDLKVALLQQADVYAAPSHMESYGMSIAEALAAGCPVVASTGTPWRELGSAGAGRWVPADPAAFRKAITEILSLDRSTTRQAAAALATGHSWDHRAAQLLDCYRGWMERGPQK
jgi:glycosyltransferase involved in cell wall biosynthesis